MKLWEIVKYWVPVLGLVATGALAKQSGRESFQTAIRPRARWRRQKLIAAFPGVPQFAIPLKPSWHRRDSLGCRCR